MPVLSIGTSRSGCRICKAHQHFTIRSCVKSVHRVSLARWSLPWRKCAMNLSTLVEVLMVVCLFAGTAKAQGVQPMPPPMLPPPMLEGNTQPIVVNTQPVVVVDGNYQ